MWAAMLAYLNEQCNTLRASLDDEDPQQQQQLVAGPQLEWGAIIALFSVAEKVSWP